ncbi:MULTISPECIES: class I SAM-dependent methyltransferase [unclassified Mycolicibacterium]|uniref:class I SAM-dependent methyltransferase n=1 Tax=unclassified Mycolicibacterium TaxID=2636767 RepID=UPI0012DED523|nr:MULTISPECIES: class I SAM-dependent methyltransferase [unclassified Mycolicibacterium]MUL81742.1 class I SAM-dependent methyltransferase [Mycolicibacterium sp. CBMA 329]MUL87508.1 class I SAM-dependent methyltransferase [Mycolicibacterium sp. CBMA 331]MUL99627.1 class I SAM-dependent methyltransferase [Mycolicibacterium sp. CBMA 334]MUM26724.1 class I SAM-dependent methyltransferase [Mycolicibacterium sp. CBMA 295]MUM37805.1 class I SAM-dependent methyltransferase [Mycolicibacterium sp. CBM
MSICRGCGGQRLQRVLDLGAVPAADHFPPVTETLGAEEVTHPLAMDLCAECGLAQLAEDDTVTAEPRGVEPQALKDQAVDAVARVAEAGWLTGKTVREFGSPHGGSWLGLLAERGFKAVEDSDGAADLVLDCFGIMHEPDQRAAFAERAASTTAGGVLLLQYHALAAIVAEGQWNALRHGHFAYYSAAALDRLLASVGMRVVDTWHFDLYGGTVLVAAVHTSDPAGGDIRTADSGSAVRTADAETEELRGGALQRAAEAQLQRLRGWLEDRHRDGLRVYGYGAASRAVALFALAGLDRTLLGAVADASPAKQGRRMPGTDIAVISTEQLVEADPDLVLLTLPDLLDEVSAALPELAGRWVLIDSLPR